MSVLRDTDYRGKVNNAPVLSRLTRRQQSAIIRHAIPPIVLGALG